MKVAIIIPAYNEQATIRSVILQVKKYGTVIVVNDGSQDSTQSEAEKAGALVCKLSQNMGYDFATLTGIREAKRMGFDAAITFDGDGQHDPNILEEIIKTLQGFDLVIGVRQETARISETVFNRYCKWKFQVSDILCGLKGYKLRKLTEYSESSHLGSVGTGMSLDIIRKGGLVSEVPVPINPRQGASSFGRGIRANTKIFYALLQAILRDAL